MEISLRGQVKTFTLGSLTPLTFYFYMNTPNDQSKSTESLVAVVEADPNNWEARKSAAASLYSDGLFLEAADMIWSAPDMPSVDVEVASAVKIVSRARPNRAIRLVYEVLRRNAGKAEQNMAMARAFSLYGLPMLASRFYGAALADGSQHFDIGFEQQSLWYDDSGSLLEAWSKSDQDVKPPFSKKVEDLVGEPIKCADLPDDVNEVSTTTSVVHVSKPAALSAAPVLQAATPLTPKVPATSAPAAPRVLKPAVPKPSTGAAPTVKAPAPLSPASPPVIKPPTPSVER